MKKESVELRLMPLTLCCEGEGTDSCCTSTSNSNGLINSDIPESDSNGLDSLKCVHKKDRSNRDRESFTAPIEFLLSCISMSVGLGNIWRFPFVAVKNGGGAFLIPYLVVLAFIGYPIYFLELSIGQFSSLGHVKIWKMVPLFKGIGYGASFATFCVISYYYSLMAPTIFYLINSFQAQLPWTICNPNWINVTCSLEETTYALLHKDHFYPNGTLNYSDASNISIASLYYKREVLKETTSIEDGIGLPEWRLALCLLAFWIMVFLCMVKGIKSSGKAAYFTAIFPYVVLIVLLIKGLTLPGASEGIMYFITPNFSELLNSKVWYAAIEQCFFSLSTTFGPVIMYASYNEFNYNVYKDALILSCTDTFTSLLAGFTIFSVMGYLAFTLDIDITQVSEGSSDMAFRAYPMVISRFESFPQVFGVLFFMMLVTLGAGSCFSDSGSIVTLIHDQFPSLKKWAITAGVCVIGFFTGLLYLTPGGEWMRDLVDYFGCVYVIVVTATLEVIGICWIYGLSNLIRDLEFMLKRKIGFHWRICWGLIVPCGLSIILFGNLKDAGSAQLEREYPPIAILFGWILTSLGLSILPIAAIHTIWTRKSTGFWNKIKESLTPSAEWGPRKAIHRQQWQALPPAIPFWSKASGESRFGNIVRRIGQPNMRRWGAVPKTDLPH